MPGRSYRTTLWAHGLRLRSVQIGATLPTGARPRRVRLDGRPARGVAVRHTHRGVEVTVRLRKGGPHTLVVTSG